MRREAKLIDNFLNSIPALTDSMPSQIWCGDNGLREIGKRLHERKP
jgi:hypothetical protein